MSLPRRSVRAQLVAAAICAGVAALWIAAGAAAGGGTISTVAGTGTAGYGGDGGPATAGQLNGPRGVTGTDDGGFLIADTDNHRVRRVAPDGTISTIAGTGTAGPGGDGGPATAALLDRPAATAITSDGGFLIADSGNDRVRKVAPDGTISTVAGSEFAGYSGDGGPATAAQLDSPLSVSILKDGGYVIADSDNRRVRRVSPTGIISTAAGTGQQGQGGDGRPATAAPIPGPAAVAATDDGGFLIADFENDQIRRVAPDGTISTAAGTGKTGDGGDGGPATAAQLSAPSGLAVLPDGGFLIAGGYNLRVRHVTPFGTIYTAAGSGTAAGHSPSGEPAGSSGDGGPATAAQFAFPAAVALTTDGGFLVADRADHRIRKVDSLEPRQPAAGKVTILRPVRGKVKVKVPGSDEFVALENVENVPVGSTVDTSKGRVRLTSAKDLRGAGQTSDFFEGVFTVKQAAAAKPVTELELTGGDFRRLCGGAAQAGGRAGAAARAKRRGKRVVRRLWGDGKGHFRTRGRFSATTVRGTVWLTEDRCDGTLTRVKRGQVSVLDLRRKKSVVLGPGDSYLAGR